MNEPELGAGINPGMAFNPFPSSIWIRQDLNPQPLDRESNSLTTRPDLRPPSYVTLQGFYLHNYESQKISIKKEIFNRQNLVTIPQKSWLIKIRF
jgi:hypothetical protein